MSPLTGESAMMRTFNASSTHNAGGFFQNRHSMPSGVFQKHSGRDEPSQILSMSDAKLRTQHSASRLQEMGSSRMGFKLAKEKEEEGYIETKVHQIESRMLDCAEKKQVKLRMQSEDLHFKNEMLT